MDISLTQFAAYSCGTYGSDAYNRDCQTSTNPTPSPSPGGFLSDTGYNVIIPLALAGALIIAGGIFLVKKYLRRKRR
ncbi:LPXTG cell wall anchor domain-containing protein [Streptomyces caniscabiei]|uniref:LPXTG cell wall anchor domain-containing protein n=1 Tax=Streptomyces caniscabiei TaxID=2746961 RepID=UPI0029B2A3D0|nr:LPXTG cell wall anchor domain-containing protein [Streptomyces caniscabiei]MDX2776517.1 LPXTG cell wall anchor domain-containing protein [Streptomyces caniscabiei]